MSGDVIDLSARRAAENTQYCFECPCGHQVFVLRPDAKIECAHCGDVQRRLIWGQFFASDTGMGPPDQAA